MLAATTVLDLVQSLGLAIIAAIAAYVAGRQTRAPADPPRARRHDDQGPHEIPNRPQARPCPLEHEA